MEYQKVFYSLKNNGFKVESDGETYLFPEHIWNSFFRSARH
jgi:hypothetical protein